MINLFRTTFLLSLLFLVLSSAHAEEPSPVTSIRGTVEIPKGVAAGINTEGLSLKGAVVTLEGKYNHPRRPYPANWQEMAPKDREAWNNKFTNSEEYANYEKKVEEAQAKRFRRTAKIADDGSFTLENIKPSWYQLTVKVQPPGTPKVEGFEYSRGWALRQFFVRTTAKPLEMGTIRLKLKNVLTVGDVAPNFTISDYEGGTYELSDFRGKYVLFDFWATWCGPCIAQIPNLEAVSEKYDGERFVTLGLSVDEKSAIAKTFLKKRPSHYKQGHVGTEEVYEAISTAYGMSSIPAIWLIDPEGKIVARDLMGREIQKAVEQVFKAPAVAP